MVFVRLNRQEVEREVQKLCNISDQMMWEPTRVGALLRKVEERIEQGLVDGKIVHLFSIISTVFNELSWPMCPVELCPRSLKNPRRNFFGLPTK